MLMALFGFVNVCNVQAEPRFIRAVEEGPVLVTLNGERIRLIGIEKMNPDKQDQLREYISGWISGTIVDVEYDVTQQDENGDLLGYVWFRYPEKLFFENMEFPHDLHLYYKYYDENNEGLFVFLNASLIKAGYAYSTTSHPNTLYTRVVNRLITDEKIKKFDREPVLDDLATLTD